ncbi:MAG TPA: PEMT/PEM2 methyltransferase family protein [Gemmatimonadales bacterium]|nr:PEMT/PEM2 methyltransferase family protein [Gemmatimonadales bacterium]
MILYSLVFAYSILSRLAYVLFVGRSLRREEGAGSDAFRRFRRRAAWVMNHDGFVFIVLCVVTRETWAVPLSTAVTVTAGAALVLLGAGTKIWAARTLGADAYYWRNFFEPDIASGPASSGPYRFVSNPMYTIGYLQTYGLALILRSFPGIIAAGFSQAAILAFYFIVERPHFRRLHRSS